MRGGSDEIRKWCRPCQRQPDPLQAHHICSYWRKILPFSQAIDSEFYLVSPTNTWGAILYKRIRTHKPPSFRRAAVSINIGSILPVGKCVSECEIK